MAAMLMASGPTVAQTSGSMTAEEAMALAQERYASVRRSSCGGEPGEIVVCARRVGDQRVPSTAESDPSSRAARRANNNGVPRAPQLDRGSCKGQAGCNIGGWAPPPVYMVDLATLPEAPEGSDADKIAKGELADR